MNYVLLTNCKPGKTNLTFIKFGHCLKEIRPVSVCTVTDTGFGIDFWHTVEFSKSGRTPLTTCDSLVGFRGNFSKLPGSLTLVNSLWQLL